VIRAALSACLSEVAASDRKNAWLEWRGMTSLQNKKTKIDATSGLSGDGLLAEGFIAGKNKKTRRSFWDHPGLFA
jgi:hypothetical protein